jgi:hypothetical protein
MRMLINVLAGAALLLWSLLCWLAYGLGDVLEDWLAANASFIAGDALIGGLIQTLLNAGQGLGLIVVLGVWLVGAAMILIPTWLLKRLFRQRQRITPVYAGGGVTEGRHRPRHSAEHAGKGDMIGKMMDRARQYR